MEFPRFVFRCPGKVACGSQKTYDQKLARSQVEFDMAVKDGWSKTLPEAMNPPPKVVPDMAVASDVIEDLVGDEVGPDPKKHPGRPRKD
jgi:hypothetical protein